MYEIISNLNIINVPIMQKVIKSSFVIIFILVVFGCQQSSSSSQKSESLAEIVTVRVFSSNTTDKKGGSGVLIDHQGDQYWVITNNHVVSDRNISYKIQTFDGREYLAQILSPRSSSTKIQKDLALLSFKASSFIYQVLKNKSQVKMFDQETVIAGGFPFADNFQQSKELKLTQGKLMMVLDEPFIGGYGVGYTNLLRNGMSGGPVINKKGELVAINGMAQEPLLGNPYVFQNGTKISELAWEKVSQLSWGISSKEIQIFVQQYYKKSK
jgi:S1-C subfamily serine protease